ncbi:hypothetical protein DL95DRAFT_466327 [Leptodontidium sp. 2 PMI_412]|nr:hypothetical protein DL95DRAFT_466327 [Leptodontidium sp. 2 PMI_412]
MTGIDFLPLPESGFLSLDTIAQNTSNTFTGSGTSLVPDWTDSSNSLLHGAWAAHAFSTPLFSHFDNLPATANHDIYDQFAVPCMPIASEQPPDNPYPADNAIASFYDVRKLTEVGDNFSLMSAPSSNIHHVPSNLEAQAEILASDSFKPPQSSFLSEPDQMSSNSTTSPTKSEKVPIACTWPTCEKSFPNIAAYNHHVRYHTLPFQCPSCPKRQATKREHDRHINSAHLCTRKYYCPVIGCQRSEDGGGMHFAREDGCRRHVRIKHSGTTGLD